MNKIHDTADTVPEPPLDCSERAGEWLRLPKPGGRFEGLSRTTLVELTVPCVANQFRPPVRSVLIKKRGAVRGIRLIERKALYEYLRRLADEQKSEAICQPNNQEVNE